MVSYQNQKKVTTLLLAEDFFTLKYVGRISGHQPRAASQAEFDYQSL